MVLGLWADVLSVGRRITASLRLAHPLYSLSRPEGTRGRDVSGATPSCAGPHCPSTHELDPLPRVSRPGAPRLRVAVTPHRTHVLIKPGISQGEWQVGRQDAQLTNLERTAQNAPCWTFLNTPPISGNLFTARWLVTGEIPACAELGSGQRQFDGGN